MNGIINIYKEKDYTSHDVIARLRGILKQRKMGHTGTLDPDATGVLPVCLGSATKVCGLLTDTDKVYEAIILLGKETDTQDISGNIIKEQVVSVTENAFREAVKSFEGEIMQVPPMYSALKVNGQRLCDLAREGKSVERAPRKVVINNIDILSVTCKDDIVSEAKLRISCSKGTYIRTLCHDIGQKLACGACMKELVRTGVGIFTIDKALTLEEVTKLRDEGKVEQHVVEVTSMFPEYSRLTVNEKGAISLSNGNMLRKSDFVEIDTDTLTDEFMVFMPDGKFMAIYTNFKDNRLFKPIKMFFDEKGQ